MSKAGSQDQPKAEVADQGPMADSSKRPLEESTGQQKAPDDTGGSTVELW